MINIPGITDVITFTLRFGTRNSVDLRILRAETHRDLANWARHLVQGAHFAAMSMKEAVFGMFCEFYCMRFLYKVMVKLTFAQTVKILKVLQIICL